MAHSKISQHTQPVLKNSRCMVLTCTCTLDTLNNVEVVHCTCRSKGYERAYLPLYKIEDTPFHTQGDVASLNPLTAGAAYIRSFIFY